MKIIVIHTIDGAVKTDILRATKICAQRRGDSLDVSFPEGDGFYEQSMSHQASNGSPGHWYVNYKNCEKFDLVSTETDITI